MSFFDINFTNVGRQLLPPDKRFPNNLALVKCLLTPMQWVSDLWLRDYRTGSLAQDWLSSSTYAKYDHVKYKFAIYESLAAGNLNNLPSDKTKWMLVQPNFIGLSERILYTGNTLTLTYALNKRFATIFRQPPNVSDIYISNNAIPYPPFVFGGDEVSSSSFFAQQSTEFFINAYSFTGTFNFTIHVPLVVYNALDPLPANRDKIFRAFVNGIVPAGITYQISTY